MLDTTREKWLSDAAQALTAALFKPAGATMPDYRVSCGWPKRASKAIGQCWHQENSADSHCEIFISPKMDNAARVLDILAHEMVHAVVGSGHGHGKVFRQLAIVIGLTGKMTATIAGEEFKRASEPILAKLGPYPHASLDSGFKRIKQGTRLIKGECRGCGYIIRTTRKWIAYGLPICPSCNIQMESKL